MSIDKSLFIRGVTEKYPEELLEKRVENEGNVIAILYKEPIMIDDLTLTKGNFITKDGKFLFSLAKSLREKGLSVFDEVSILSNTTDEVIDRFKELGGYDTIDSMTSVVNLNNADTYISILYRENTILQLYSDGFNVTKPIDINGKMISPLKLFRKMKSEEITDFYEARMTSFQNGYSSKILEEEEIDFDDEYLNSAEDGLENGTPFTIAGTDISGEDIQCLPFLSNHIMGLKEKTFSIIGGYSSTGKSTLFITVLMGLLEDPSKKVLIISNEMQISDFKKNFIIWVLCQKFKYFNLTKKKFSSGVRSEEDKKMIKKAQQYWREKYKGRVKMIAIPGADMSLVKKEIRKNVLRYGYNVCLYDTMKLDFDSAADKKEYLSLIKDSRDFEEISKKYNIIMLASLQLAINTLGKLFLDASVLSFSKQIKETVSNLVLIRTIYKEEMDPNSKFFFKPYKLKKVNGKWIREEKALDPNGVYRAVFIDKCRTSSNTSDTGQALCYKYLGEFAIFKESCWIEPKHGYIQ